jgi:hypothetical protein
MRVRAKFHCNFKDANVIHLGVVYGGSSENEKFFKYTPGGQITLNVLNEDAAAQFVQGKEYYVDFTPAE